MADGRNIKLVLSYDGTEFHGWQRQKGLRTVQRTLDEAIGQLTGEEPVTNASGRTDAGVHALGQVVNFRTTSRHPPTVFVKALNALMPNDVRVRSAEEVHWDFHATLDATGKLYRYVVDNNPIADPFQRRHSYHVYPPLDVEAMNRAARALIGTHDFRSFESDWPNRASSVRTVTRVAASRLMGFVWIDAEADGFLYNMVRAIAGTLVLVGTGRWPESKVEDALKAQDRTQAGPTAPPQGLYLVRVDYPPQGPTAGDSADRGISMDLAANP